VAALRFGVLGAARIAPPALVKPAVRNPTLAQVVSVAARDPNRARQFAAKHGIPKTAASYEDLLADPDIDAVYNPLPNALHGRWTLAALAAGKHVLCEKPFTANAAEARQVAGVAAAAHASSGLVVMEAFHYRHHPVAQRISAIVSGGELGDVQRVEVAFSAPIPRKGDIRYQLALAGGALMDMGCYAVNFVRMVAGEPHVAAARAKRSSPHVDRAMRVDYLLSGGGTATTSVSMFSSSILRMSARVIGTEGELRVFNPFAPQYWHRLRVRDRTGWRTERLTRRPTYDFQLEHFVSAVLGDGPVITTPEDAVGTMAVIDAAYEAAGLGARVPA
jgi:predicted dehydrogenase